MRRGFTLLEMLVVLTIILFLVTATLSASLKARKRAATSKVEATISSLEVALSMYETDFGDYPPGDGVGCEDLVHLLSGPIDNPLWKGPYIRFKEKELKNNELLDSWGNSYIYQYPQTVRNNVPFLIFSRGADEEEDTADDIGNW